MSHSLYSPRGRNRRQFSSPVDQSLTLLPDRDLLEGLEPKPLQTLVKPASVLDDKDVGISNFQYIGSYNWTDSSSPTIIVPGSPREWQNKPPPYQVRPDLGIVFVDQNGARSPSAILLPLITAVNTKFEDDGKAPFDWESLDFVTDRNGLRKLLKWIDIVQNKDFRIDLQLAGRSTILLNRWEKRTREWMPGRSYGFNFEKTSTAPARGCEMGTGHHRIVRYELNGLKMVVRFEVDACIPSESLSSPRSSTSGVEDLIGAFSGFNLRSAEIPQPPPTSSVESVPKLTVIKGGSYVEQSAVVELTTRSNFAMKQNGIDWKDCYPQLFLSQTAHHFLAVHDRGRFTQVNKRKLTSPELQKVANSIQPDLRNLRRVLATIQNIVIEHGKNGRLSLVCEDGELRVFRRISQDSCLPDEILDLFDS